jgi:hypothetical protein
MQAGESIALRESPAPSRFAALPGPREGLWLGVALALLSCLPFLVAAYPQMTDYPSHLARYHVMLDGGRNADLARYYAFEWRWTGNLGADLLIRPMAALFGLERGGWLLGLMIAPLTCFGILAVEWTLRRRIGVGSCLAMATVWSPALSMGFYNFCLSLALALFAFALWVRLEQWRWRWALFLPLALVVWLFHVSGWGVLGVMVFGYEWSRTKGFAAVLRPWPLTLPFAAVLLTGTSAAGMLSFGRNALTYKIAIWMRAMRDQSMELDTATLVLILFAIAAALLRRRIDGRLGWAALLLGILTLAMPRHFGGGDYADYRLIAAALLVGCLAIDWRAPRWLLWIAPALFLVRLGVTASAWHAQSREVAAMMPALDSLPRGARVAGAEALDSDAWALEAYGHLPSYATVRRDALVNTHFAIPGIHMLRLKQGGPGFADPSQRIFYRKGDPIDLAAFEPARQADYLWYIGRQQPARLPPGATILYRSGGSFLARLANPHIPR